MHRYTHSLLMILVCGMLSIPRANGLPAERAMALTLTSPAFVAGRAIPSKYTCEGHGLSPPMAWHVVPTATKSLVLIKDDPDAPDPAVPMITWVHWLLYDLPPTSQGLPEGMGKSALPTGTREGRNDRKRNGYGGPAHRLAGIAITTNFMRSMSCWAICTSPTSAHSKPPCTATSSRRRSLWELTKNM